MTMFCRDLIIKVNNKLHLDRQDKVAVQSCFAKFKEQKDSKVLFSSQKHLDIIMNAFIASHLDCYVSLHLSESAKHWLKERKIS